MYPDNAFYEFYPQEIVDEILLKHPGVTMERLHSLMQAQWDAKRRTQTRKSVAELADELGL